MRPLLIGTALAVLLAVPAFGQERLVDATKVFPMLDKFYASPPGGRSLLAMRYNFTQDGKPATALHLTLVAGGRRTPLPIAPDGRVERIPTSDEMAEHAQVVVDAPKGAKLAAHMSVDTAIRPTAEVSASECAKAIDQYNAQLRRQAGVMAMVIPKAKACTFPGSGSGVAVMPDGKTQPIGVIKGLPAFEPDAIRGAKTVRLTRAPSVVSLE